MGRYHTSNGTYTILLFALLFAVLGWMGDVWSFAVEGKANNPYPTDGAEDVPVDVVLSWTPGVGAADVNGHDVYFSTDFGDVNDANTSTAGVYKGNQDPCEYDPQGNLALDTTYYWRIDEVNDPCTWKGDVWSFTTANYLIVDDMESYNETGNWIYYTWIDGLGNLTGSLVELGQDPIDPVHGGTQSMIYLYDSNDQYGSDKYSEISRTFDAPCDWTEQGVKVLTLFFYGDADNDANEQMYLGLEDSCGPSSYAQVDYGYYGDEDMNDIKKQEWQEWNITLTDFNGVDANDVNKVYIGFGDRDNPVPDGNGTVYFDDIRLYPPKCIPSRLKPVADLSSNCVVDVADIGVMAEDWLETEHAMESPANLYAAEPPDEQVINFRDYAVLMDSWLEEKLWPPEQ